MPSRVLCHSQGCVCERKGPLLRLGPPPPLPHLEHMARSLVRHELALPHSLVVVEAPHLSWQRTHRSEMTETERSPNARSPTCMHVCAMLTRRVMRLSFFML